MWRTIVRTLMAHKLRLSMTALAVVLGVAFVAGTLMLTDTIERGFEDVITSTAGSVDLEVRPEGDAPAFEMGFADREAVPAELVDVVAGVDGVAVADPEVLGFAVLLDSDGQPIGGMGPPTIGVSAPSGSGVGGLDVREGSLPEREGEVAIDAFTARTQGFAVGDTVLVAAQGPVEEAEITGIVGFGEADNLMGATVTLFDLDTAVARFSVDGDYDTIQVIAEPGVSRDELAEAIAAAIGPDYEAVTAEQLVDENLEAVGQFLGVFNTALLVFAVVALFVGSFLIFNTFTIIVAQRARELALLRAVGARRSQILQAVVGEAALVGLVGGVVGFVVGASLAVGLRELLAGFGVELPTEGLVLQPRTVVVALVVGLGVTCAAALVPAVRATRVAPVEALQAVAAPPQAKAGWVRTAVATLLAVVGIALLLAGLFGDAGIAAVGAGAAVLFLGVAGLSPLVTRPIVRVVGLPVRMLGVRGDLARENAMRNPRRTAATAAALMIGVGLVGFVAIFATSMKASITDAIDEVYLLDYDVRSTTFQPIPAEIEDVLADVEGVELAAAQRLGEFRDPEADATRMLMAAHPDELPLIYDVDLTAGDLSAWQAEGGLLVSESAAERDGLEPGDAFAVEFTAGGARDLPVHGVYDGQSVDIDYIIDTATYEQVYRSDVVFAVAVRLADGVDSQTAGAAIDDALEPYPAVQSMDRTAVRENIVGQIDQLLGLVFALLFLSVVIAFVGIVNTLALSVFERVRELGLLRAVGMTRSQVRSMVRWESVLIAILGAVLGLAIGVFFGWLLVRALRDQFELRLVVPFGQLIAAMVIAALAGILAGALPARRAARVDILRAINAE